MASAATEPTWLEERRRAGASRADGLELPHPKAKGWEFTDLSELDFDAFAEGSASIDGLKGSTDDGVIVMSLAAATEAHPDLVAQHLGTVVPADDIFTARNDARWRDGVFVHVPEGVRMTKPLQLGIAAAAGDEVEWRALIVLGDGAEAEVWERYESDGPGLFNGVVELVVGAAANLRYVCEQDISDEGWVFATQRAELGRDANLDWVALGFGSARGKVRMETKLAGRGSSAKVTGAYAGTGSQHLDYDTTQEHAAPNTFSDLAFRGVLGDSSTAVWRGMIRVDKDAQHTDAFQESRNLLLSPKAHADAIPGLEIEADDVRCTHAAAVAQVDAEQLYYLRSRGISEGDAKRLVIDGFLQELVERTIEGPIRDALAGALGRRLSELLGVIRPLVVILALSLSLLAGCGGERTFEAQELIDALADEGAELNLGERLPSTQEGVEVFEVSLADDTGPGSLVVAEDEDTASAEFTRCEAAITLACFRAANVVLYFEGDPTEAHIAGVGVAIRALASD